MVDQRASDCDTLLLSSTEFMRKCVGAVADIHHFEDLGDLSPSLKGAGARWSEGELRLRLVDAARLNPATIMPSYYRLDGLTPPPLDRVDRGTV